MEEKDDVEEIIEMLNDIELKHSSVIIAAALGINIGDVANVCYNRFDNEIKPCIEELSMEEKKVLVVKIKERLNNLEGISGIFFTDAKKYANRLLNPKAKKTLKPKID